MRGVHFRLGRGTAMGKVSVNRSVPRWPSSPGGGPAPRIRRRLLHAHGGAGTVEHALAKSKRGLFWSQERRGHLSFLKDRGKLLPTAAHRDIIRAITLAVTDRVSCVVGSCRPIWLLPSACMLTPGDRLPMGRLRLVASVAPRRFRLGCSRSLAPSRKFRARANRGAAAVWRARP